MQNVCLNESLKSIEPKIKKNQFECLKELTQYEQKSL
jgi:hypothetical protein